MTLQSLATRLLLGLAAVTLLGVPAQADGHEGQWYVTPMISFVEAVQLGFGRDISENWMVEFNLFGANLDDRYLQNNQKLRGAGVDWLRYFRNDSWLTPYGLVGLGYLSTDTALGDDSQDMFGSLGVGLMAKFDDDGIGLRAEARMRSVSATAGGFSIEPLILTEMCYR